MLDANLKDQLKAYLERVSLPFEIVASLDDGEKSQELLGLLNDIVSLTDKITLKTDGNDARRPSFALNRPGEDTGVVFAGIPMGHEFTSLVLALLQVGGHPSKLDADTIAQIKSIEGKFEFETYFSLSCQNCQASGWTQSFTLDARSGYTQGTVGFGLDVLGLYSV